MRSISVRSSPSATIGMRAILCASGSTLDCGPRRSRIGRMDERMRRRKARLLALALSLLAALLVAELTVRVLVGAPLRERLPVMRVRANPYRGWEMVPSEDHYTYEHLVHVNALGLRGRESSRRRPARCASSSSATA